MAQKNIDFGTFPDAPNADAIRTAFQKAQENFDELYNFQRTQGVLSINKTSQPGITINQPTGNVLISANIAQVQIRTTSLGLGLNAPGSDTSATLTSSFQSIYIDLKADTNISNSLIIGNSTVNTTITSSSVLSNNITGTLTVDSNSQPNITSVGSLTSLAVTGVSNLGPIGNVIISGGNTGEILTTDGTGNLSWTKNGFAENVIYVSKSGNDSYSGTELSRAKLTIKAAAALADTLQTANPSGTTVILVKAGDYTEDNPISLSAGVSIVGDNLRTVSVRPDNPTQDIFWVRNRCYLTGMTFRDHLEPSAAVAFPSTGAGNIFTSPYVQNCSSITTTGCGMRIDGDLAGGLKSMVLDSYTQFNQGGLGIHIINQGYAQLVSIFTICCTAGVKCEAGGTCSITNSNNSFGDYGLWADGAGPILYTGTLISSTRSTLTIGDLTQRPAPNDSVLITDGINTQYVLVRSATPLSGDVSVITFKELLEITPVPSAVTFQQISLITASGQTFEYVGTGTDLLTSTPRLGGIPIQENEIYQTNGGRVNFTSTDQFGDFRVGSDFAIIEEAGIIEGTTFDRSLFAVLTPYILALEG